MLIWHIKNSKFYSSKSLILKLLNKVKQGSCSRCNKLSLCAIVLGTLLCLSSCINERCVKGPSSALRLQLYTKDSQGADSLLNNVQIMYRTRVSDGSWPQFTARGVGSILSLPINRAEEQTSYVFAAFNADSMVWLDTLSIQYSRNLTFLSESCGFEYFFQIGALQSKLFVIDSAILVRTLADTTTQPNVKIYFP